MTFQINGYSYNLCHTFLGEHVWIWNGSDTLTIPWPDMKCSCGAISYKNRDHPEREIEDKLFKELEDASIYDYLIFEEQE